MGLFGKNTSFWTGNNGSGGGSGGGCKLNAEFLFASEPSIITDGIRLYGQAKAGIKGIENPLTVTIDAAILYSVHLETVVMFDRIGCDGDIDFTLDATDGLLDTGKSITQTKMVYTLPSNRSQVSIDITYNSNIQPGTYTLSINANCGTCTATTEIKFIIPGGYKYGYGGLALGGGTLLGK